MLDNRALWLCIAVFVLLRYNMHMHIYCVRKNDMKVETKSNVPSGTMHTGRIYSNFH